MSSVLHYAVLKMPFLSPKNNLRLLIHLFSVPIIEVQIRKNLGIDEHSEFFRAGSRKDMEIAKEYINDLLSAAKQANGNRGIIAQSVFRQYPGVNDTWLANDAMIKETTKAYEEIMLSKWQGRSELRGVSKDGYLLSQCNAVVQAQQLDIGSISNLNELNTGVGFN